MDANLAGVVTGIAAFAGLVVVLFFAITHVTRALMGSERRLESALGAEVLRARLDRGEITMAEYDQATPALRG